MKTSAMRLPIRPLLLILITFIAFGCETDRDKAIKADIAAKAKGNLDFAGVDYVVEEGFVTLSGNCPTQFAKQTVENIVKKIRIINGVRNEIAIAPVLIDADLQTKLSLDSILTTYPRVTGKVEANEIVLMGKADTKQSEELIAAIQKWRPIPVRNELEIE